MKSKRLTAALTGLCLLWGSAHALDPQAPDATGATGPGIQMRELQGAQPAGEPSPEELLAMQILLLQLLMMQSEPGGGETMTVPGAEVGTRI